MGKHVNKSELAEIFGVSERTFTEWQKDESFPFEINGGRGSGNVYDTEKVIAWKIGRDVAARSGEKPKDRLDRVKADKIEVEIAKALDELAPALMFEQVWIDHIVLAKTEFQALPHRLASWLQDEYQIDVPLEPIAAMVDLALGALEGTNVYDDFDESPLTQDDANDSEEDD